MSIRTGSSCSFIFSFIFISKHRQRAGLYRHFHTHQHPYTPTSIHTRIHTHKNPYTQESIPSAAIHISIRRPRESLPKHKHKHIDYYQQHQADKHQSRCPPSLPGTLPTSFLNLKIWQCPPPLTCLPIPIKLLDLKLWQCKIAPE